MNAAGHTDDVKRFLDGSHRGRDPEETLRRVAPLLARCGITRVANLTGLDRVGIPVVAAYRPNARSIAVSQEHRGRRSPPPALRGSWKRSRCGTRSTARCRCGARQRWLCRASGRSAIWTDCRAPRAGRDDERHIRRLWAEGRNLFDGSALWCPLEIVDADYTRGAHDAAGTLLRSTNGLASGNGWSEAVGAHGLCELIERDAVSVWRARASHRGVVDGRVDPRERGRYRLSRAVVALRERRHRCRHLERERRHRGADLLRADPRSRDPRRARYGAPRERQGLSPPRRRSRCRARADGGGADPPDLRQRCPRRSLGRRLRPRASARQRSPLPRALLDDEPPLCPPSTTALCRSASTPRSMRMSRDFWTPCAASGSNRPSRSTWPPDTSEISVVRMIVPGLEGPDEHPAYVPGERALRA